jgi:methylmalonyl-CoA decarboxylase subunit alpha
MPWITIVTGRLYGVGGQCHHRPTGMFRRYAWPSASWGSMHIAGGASAAYRREIEEAADPEAKRQEIESRLNLLASPFRTAEATGQDIIDPRDTRPRGVRA